VPVVIHFKLFETLVNIGKAATAEEIFAANNAERSEEEKAESPLCEFNFYKNRSSESDNYL
jgi:hypothetical protein